MLLLDFHKKSRTMSIKKFKRILVNTLLKVYQVYVISFLLQKHLKFKLEYIGWRCC